MIGGSLLLDGIRSMAGHGGGFFSTPAFGASQGSLNPWWDSSNSGRDSSVTPGASGSADWGGGTGSDERVGGSAGGEAGVDDYGRSADSSDSQGVFGGAGGDADQDYAGSPDDSDFGDSGDFGFGGSDSDIA
jgi:hypothetical protein